MGVLVEPKQGSYVTEWEAVQVCGADCFPAVRRLLKGSPWVAQLILTDKGAHITVTQMTPMGMDHWNVMPGEWVVKSPHGRFWFMSETEFLDQFEVTP
jgi:hypothetical protein